MCPTAECETHGTRESRQVNFFALLKRAPPSHRYPKFLSPDALRFISIAFAFPSIFPKGRKEGENELPRDSRFLLSSSSSSDIPPRFLLCGEGGGGGRRRRGNMGKTTISHRFMYNKMQTFSLKIVLCFHAFKFCFAAGLFSLGFFICFVCVFFVPFACVRAPTQNFWWRGRDGREGEIETIIQTDHYCATVPYVQYCATRRNLFIVPTQRDRKKRERKKIMTPLGVPSPQPPFTSTPGSQN